MLKKLLVISFALSVLINSCSKKNITNNYYTSSDKGSIIGFVYPPNSQAKITASLGLEMTSTQIDTNGYFELNDLRSGSYSLMIEAEGYFDYRPKEILVFGGTRISIDTVFLISVHDLIASVSPSDGAEGINLGVPIRIVFRKLMDQTSVEKAFHIEPKTGGTFLWYNDRYGPNDLSFVPDNLLMSNTLYRITIDSTASDKDSIKLFESYRFSFTTEPIRIVNTQPRNQDTWIAPSTYISISFNAHMNIETVNSAFNMTDSHLQTVDGEFSWQNQQWFAFRPYVLLASNEEYTVTLDTTATDIPGGRLPELYRFSFTTEPLRILATSPRNHETWVDPSINIMISFNTQMSAESVILAFKMVDSELRDVIGNFNWAGSQGLIFNPNMILEYDETYTVTIDTNAKDISGGSLEKPYNFWFKTRPY